MYIDNVVIEITRRCNMKCPHCLRGPAESRYISDRVLSRFFLHLRGDSIGNLAITGGEPSLAPSRIRKIVYFARLYGVSIGHFYMVTNAKKAPMTFIKALIELHQYCDDPGSCTVVYSNDKFHERQHYGWDMLSQLEFFHDGKDNDRYPLSYDNLIDMGSAKHNQMAQKELVLHRFLIEEDDDHTVDIREGTIYLNALGKILPDCDLSYEVQREKSIILGDVFDQDFSLLRYAEQFNARMDRLAPHFSDDAVLVQTFEPNGEGIIKDVVDMGHIRPKDITITEFLEAA